MKSRPNIVLIMADDLGCECLEFCGGASYDTPSLNRLAGNGVSFEHCYSTPLCTPSRVQIMTGKYNCRNYEDFEYLNPRETTFANLLRSAGYKTAIAGKWQLNGVKNGHPRCYDNTRPFEAGFDEYCLWQLTKRPAEGERYWRPLIEKNGRLLDFRDNPRKYGPDIFCKFTCDFIARNAKIPFFAYYPMVLTHRPFLSTPESERDKGTMQENFKDMVAYMDKLVGKVLRSLERHGLLKNTLFLFTADNGTDRLITSRTVKGNIRGGKGTLPDAGTRVPFVAYWEGRTPPGYVCTDLIDFTDVLPTLAEAAGYNLPGSFAADGTSFLPRITGMRGALREWVFCHYEPRLAHQDSNSGRFARTKRFKLYGDGRFYDVPGDPLEKKRIRPAGREAGLKRAVKNKLQAVLDSMPESSPPALSRGWNRLKKPDTAQKEKLHGREGENKEKDV